MARPKGCKNLDTLKIEELAAEMGINPMEVLFNFVKGSSKALGFKPTPDQILKATEQACQYLYPKRKALEHTISDDMLKMIIHDYSSKDKCRK